MMWQGRAVQFLEAIAPPLRFLADKGFLLLDPKLLRDFCELSNIEDLLWFGIFVDPDGRIVNLKKGSQEHRSYYNEMYERYCCNLRLYVESLPGYAVPKQPHRPTHMETLDWAAIVTEPDPPSQDEPLSEQRNKKTTQLAQMGRANVLEQHGYVAMQLLHHRQSVWSDSNARTASIPRTLPAAEADGTR